MIASATRTSRVSKSRSVPSSSIDDVPIDDARERNEGPQRIDGVPLIQDDVCRLTIVMR
jgi:hypothetical protein